MRRHRRRSSAPVVAALASAGLLLAGCGGSGGDGPAGGAPTTGPQDTPTTGPGAAEPLLEVVVAGGFGIAGSDFARPPELTVYEDGRAITHGPQIAIYPPPALPNLLQYSLTEEELQSIVDEAGSAGLLQDPPPDYGRPPIADAPTTTVTLLVEGQEYRHTAESFDVGQGAADGGPVEGGPAEGGAADGAAADDEPVVAPEGVPEPGSEMTEDQRGAREALSAFFHRAREIVTSAGEEEFYDIEAFAVLARAAGDDTPGDGDTGRTDDVPAAPEDDIQPAVLAWPLDVALADATECVTVTGPDAQALRDSLEQADALTRFEDDGTAYDVWARPLLPHEEDCVDVQSMLAGP